MEAVLEAELCDGLIVSVWAQDESYPFLVFNVGDIIEIFFCAVGRVEKVGECQFST